MIQKKSPAPAPRPHVVRRFLPLIVLFFVYSFGVLIAAYTIDNVTPEVTFFLNIIAVLVFLCVVWIIFVAVRHIIVKHRQHYLKQQRRKTKQR